MKNGTTTPPGYVLPNRPSWQGGWNIRSVVGALIAFVLTASAAIRLASATINGPPQWRPECPGLKFGLCIVCATVARELKLHGPVSSGAVRFQSDTKPAFPCCDGSFPPEPPKKRGPRPVCLGSVWLPYIKMITQSNATSSPFWQAGASWRCPQVRGCGGSERRIYAAGGNPLRLREG